MKYVVWITEFEDSNNKNNKIKNKKMFICIKEEKNLFLLKIINEEKFKNLTA